MKVTKSYIEGLVKEELDAVINEEEGSFFKTAAGDKFNRLMGMQGFFDALEEAEMQIGKIEDVAVKSQSETQVDYGGAGAVDDKENFALFQGMIDQCKSIRKQMNSLRNIFS